ncbi:sulfurtransferase FdhD [Malaciobacter pacificus]|uniref:Sulfur carrier protein FdhD n=1 Tax=Malaciobacter pacificus TaxID=1080223 RepID=A0A5C2HAB6_9BACT|nr:formate dehydrogenase accessory sulfurtransferase FdhD [Malaciobacter pacificus]QEP34106.1 formate dehydrogenase accessory protein [Malaciobacter pacificus]GGD40483.1 sulfurtransferase FdhD [Malaciobacter pacificus]
MENAKYLKTVVIDKLIENEATEVEDVTIEEARLNLYLNGEKAISMMTIPKDQEAHAIGFLMSENVISSIEDINTINLSEDGLRVDVSAKINEESLKHLYKEKTLTSGCGGGVTGTAECELEIPFNQTAFKVKPKTILDEIKIFYKESELYNLTGCVHKAMIYLLDGTTITAEDIGRHNAIDKAIGKCKLAGLDTTKSILFVSGRLSSEMVTKAVMHRVPIVVSRTAPTYLGVQTAHKHGITLIGFARGRKMNLYTHSGRIDLDV